MHPDYPALSTFLGRTTKGYFACIHCDKHPLSYRLRSKIRYFGNFWFLPKGHCLRKNNEFAGLHESNGPPKKFTTEEIIADLDKAKDVRPGKQQESWKRKRFEMEVGRVQIWSQIVRLPSKIIHGCTILCMRSNIPHPPLFFLVPSILKLLPKHSQHVLHWLLYFSYSAFILKLQVSVFQRL